MLSYPIIHESNIFKKLCFVFLSSKNCITKAQYSARTQKTKCGNSTISQVIVCRVWLKRAPQDIVLHINFGASTTVQLSEFSYSSKIAVS